MIQNGTEVITIQKKVNAESKAWISKGLGQLRISPCTLHEELYLLCRF